MSERKTNTFRRRVSPLLFRAVVSLALSSSLIASCAAGLVSAAPMGDSPISTERESSPVEPVLGQLTIKKGDVVVNGNTSKTGATVVSGSVIATSSGGEAIIDLEGLGRIELGSHTTVALSFEPGIVVLKSECGRTEVKVYCGHVDVTSPKVESIQAAHEKEYGDPVNLTAPAETDFRVECERSKLIVLVPLGLPSLLLLGLRSSSGGDVLDAPPSGESPPVTPTTP